MKGLAAAILALCLLLSGCGAPAGGSSQPEPTEAPVAFVPHYSDYTHRGMTATILSGADRMPAMGMLNNLYKEQTATLFEVLAPTTFLESYLKAPDETPYIQVTFRPYSDQNGECYTLYETDLVVVTHPSAGKQVCTAPSGTYERVLNHLLTVHKEQEQYVRLTEKNGKTGYTLRYKSGKSEFIPTGTDNAQIDLVGKGLVRVLHRNVTRLYDTIKGRTMKLSSGLVDVCGDYLVAAEKHSVALYSLFGSKAIARVWVAAVEDQSTVQGMNFSADGKQLHVVCAVGDAVYDRTFQVATLKKGKVRYLLGDWEAGGGYVSEDVAQSVGYKALKKLRGKQKKLGYTLSAQPLYRYVLSGETYYLTEIGHWTDQDGTYTYTVDAHLMVRKNLSAGYLATLKEDELSWDTGKDWFD